MKKKGFTLVEIIICIGLIAIVGTVSIVSINVLKNNKENKILDTRNLLNLLKEKNILDCEKDRLYKRYRFSIKSEKQACYIFKISRLYDN